MSRDSAAGDPGIDHREELRLAQSAASGDGPAQREVALVLLDRVRRTARYILRNEADADDAAQSAMVEILRCLGRYRGTGSLAHWASRIVARTALAFARRRRADPTTVERLREPPAVPLAPDGTAGDGPMLRRRLVRCLDRLPAERRETVVLRLIEGMTLDEIAEETGVSVNTAKDRLRVGRAELRSAVLDDPVLREALKERLP
ncbi:MAG: sigma-70 family RNA polymerase sigma factor [Deltaproteobacteria bacterium]|nr:sigma-70 family RNA polymerase sigma factor [Deltaproteobacteria bacterium]